MPKYLTMAEVPLYCEFFTNITETTIEFAEQMVDMYLDEELLEQTSIAEIKLTRKNTGKLPNRLVNSIVTVTGIYMTSSGFVESTLDVANVKFQKNGYFEYLNFVTPLSINQYLNYPLYSLKIQYTHGYATVPKNLKRAVAMICQGLAEKRTFSSLKAWTTLDTQITLFDDSIFTKDIKMILDGLVI
jgi:hypothetical protein